MKEFFKALLDRKNPHVPLGGFLLIAIIFISFFDNALAVGLLFIFLLTLGVFIILFYGGVKNKDVYLLFLIAIAVHLGAVACIVYSNFHLGGGADFTGYHQSAMDIAERFRQGNFSLDGVGLLNYWPVLVAVVYAVTIPAMIVGQLFTVFLSALAILVLYFIIIEIGGFKKVAFWFSLLVVFYPSHLYFGSVLLKDAVVIPLILLGLWLSLRMYKKFSVILFLGFFLILTCLTHLRFYVGFALLFSFIISWFLLSNFNIKKRAIYGLVMISILGFSSQILGNGYYGFNNFKEFLNIKKITDFREVTYNSVALKSQEPSAAVVTKASNPAPAPAPAPIPTSPANSVLVLGSVPSIITPKTPTIEPVPVPQKAQEEQSSSAGEGSSFVIETGFKQGPLKFVENSLRSFVYALLGPFPWQIRYQRQIIALLETIPWYIFIVLWMYLAVDFIKKRGGREFLRSHAFALPLLLFGVFALGALSLFINNYGIITRIRIPMILSFVAIMSLIFNNYHEKISHYWRSGLYWLASFKKTVRAGK